ncbi:hypothetical protein ACGFS9_20775 [Streptomyces sp. NPDC048566]|uniref:hypothetical protein n=1 Tax=Streptomyces sp. NPDC048566 TaxID=3365569 RepID=UPI003710944D
MLALRLARAGSPLVQLRRLLVAAASAGTGFLLLCTLGYAMSHPDASAAGALRLAWCVVPLAATVYFALAVARTDPGTRPRPGLSAVGLGPGRLMAVSALTTALSTLLGSALALLLFLQLRGDLTGVPSAGTAAEFLAVDQELPLPAALTLLALVPLAASAAAALALRPRDGRGRQAARAYGLTWLSARQGAVAGARPRPAAPGTDAEGPVLLGTAPTDAAAPSWPSPADGGADAHRPAAAPAAARVGAQDRSGSADRYGGGTAAAPSGTEAVPGPVPGARTLPAGTVPNGLPWGAAAVAAGLAVETYASRSGPAPALAMPGGFAGGPAGVLAGWVLTAVGLALAGPAITSLCGRLLQAVRPGAVRLLAGRVLQAEARRVGQPLGVVCAVASGAFAMTALYTGSRPAFGPLTTLGALLVAGCTLLTLVTAAVEAKQDRADTTAALLRLGAPAATLRGAAALRVAALFAAFAPLTWAVAELAALPLID